MAQAQMSPTDEILASLVSAYGTRFAVELDVNPTKEGYEVALVRSAAIMEETPK